MNTAKVTNSDRAAVVRDGWRRAYGFAIAAGEPVRLHLGEAFRAAWAAFRQARAEGSVVAEQTAEYEEQYGRSDRAEARAYLAAMLVEKAAEKAEAVEDHWSTFGPAAGVSPDEEDDLGCDLDDEAESPAAPVQLDLVHWLVAQPAMVPQPVQQQQACAAQGEAAAAEPERTEAAYGRARFVREGDSITFRGQVTGGGVAGPGRVSAYRGFSDSDNVRMHEDNRSGSQRSGSCLWRLQPDTVYWISNVAMDSRSSGSVGLSTYDGGLRILDRDAFEAERRRVWPLQAEEHDAAEAQRRADEARRMEAERVLAEERRVAREALAELNAEAVARIKAEGQPRVEGLPKLTGTVKQVAYALKIRDAVRARQADLPALRAERASKFWIENYRNALR